ncbi:NAD(P)H-hydrate dehydratase [Burkholderia plantarii]|uniref:NAD(P)H-hydrate dehydratase n=1 Tax=Burkholderia plantarii TaxID=41899 RepID=UPI0018DB504A|nr:NAD(P)H-hydrate dehydratase [Burkholderia plantarii]MBI0328174.1 NAD(P)H-hydrate dehydratase [Burkholderia plantarii]
MTPLATLTAASPSPSGTPADPFAAPLAHQPLPLATVADLRAAEAAALQPPDALPPHTLMARAGAAAARWLAARTEPDARPVWLAAGPGNNGGDALVAAAELLRLGVQVEVCLPIEPKPEDARWALALARKAGVPISTEPPASFDGYGWLVDGLFGIGLARALDGPFATLAAALSARARTHGRVLALDIPSGIDADSGARVGDGPAVLATHTLSMLAAKPGLYLGDGRDHAGEVTIETLDASVPASATLNAAALFASHWPARASASHKGSFGSVAIVGGDTGMCGAPILAARAALHAGAGKVHVGFIGEDAPPYDPPFPELMLHPAQTLPTDGLSAIGIGCGLGTRERARDTLRAMLALDLPIVVDADALNLVAGDAGLASALTARAARGAASILTPHPLEAARLLGSDARAVQADRLAAARGLATRYAAIAVLKGSGTMIAHPDGRVAVNPTGNAALATGGTGDVLGGLIAAFLAQRIPAYEAALGGVYLHGLAADCLTALGDGPAGLAAGELAGAVRRLVNRHFYSRVMSSVV